MKVKSILAAGMLLSSIAASQARADSACQLTVNPSSYVELGHSFSYGIDIAPLLLPGPWPPDGPPGPPFTVVFQGTGIPASGEQYPATFTYYHSDLTGYQNPASGGFSGTYLRYAVVYDSRGHTYCTTNTVAVVLQ